MEMYKVVERIKSGLVIAAAVGIIGLGCYTYTPTAKHNQAQKCLDKGGEYLEGVSTTRSLCKLPNNR